MRIVLSVMTILACILHASSARALGSAWSEAATARIVYERDVVVFDPEAQIEHLIVQVRFQSDAKVHALIVPMPAAPLADRGYAVEDEILFGRLESIVRYDDPGLIPDAPEMEMLAQSSARTAQGTVMPDASALSDWLKLEKFTERPALTQWVARYTKSKWALNAVRLSDDDHTTPVRVVQSPALRFSFHAAAAVLPYTEAPPEQMGTVKGHALDVWVVAPTPVDLVQADPVSGRVTFGGLERRSATRVSGVDLEASVGKLGPFDPRGHDQWVVTRFTERGKGPRAAVDDLSVVTARAIGAHAQRPKRGGLRAWMALALGLIAATLFAFYTQREKNSR
jgi:hypothetical protein